jgi:hypothetical protein
VWYLHVRPKLLLVSAKADDLVSITIAFHSF